MIPGKRRRVARRSPIVSPNGNVSMMPDSPEDPRRPVRSAEDSLEPISPSERELLLDWMLDFTEEGVLVADEHGRVLLCNRAGSALFGLTCDEIAGGPLDRLLPQAIRDEHREWVARFATSSDGLSTPRPMGELHGVTARGEEIPLEGRLSKVDIGGRRCVAIFLRDLRPRLAEAAAARGQLELREQLARIVETSPGVVYSFRRGPDGKVSFPYMSPAIEGLFPVSRSAAARDGTTLFDYLHPDDVPALAEASAISERDLSLWRSTFRVRHPERGEIWLEGCSSPVREADGGTVWHGVVTDVTSRLRAEATVREAMSLQRATLDGLSAHLAVLVTDGRIVAVNRAWKEFATGNGGALGAVCEGANYLEACDRVEGDDRPVSARVAEAIRATIAGTTGSASFEYPCHSPDGPRWFVVRVTAMDGAPPRRVIVAHESITERKLHEMALRASEERYRALMETTFEWIWEVDASGRYTFASPRVADLLGYTPEELIGRTPFELMRPDEAERLSALFARSVAGRERLTAVENVNLHRDGHEVVLETSGVPVFDAAGELTGYRGMDRDITERKRAEADLREREARYAALVETSPEAIYVNREDRVALVNPACLRLFGATSPEQLLGRPTLELFHPDFHEAIRERVRRLRELGEPVPLAEERIVRLDGQTVDVEVVAAPFLDQGVRAIHVVLRDLTERKRLEAARVSSQKLEALGTLATGIAHDFNNLLLAIRGNARLAAADSPAGGETRTSLDEVEKACVRGAELVRRILAFGRPESPHREILAVRPILEEAVALLRATLPARITLDVDAGPAELRLEVDGGQLHQAVVNLLANAGQAIGEASGRIALRVETIDVGPELAREVAELREGRYVRLRVTDDGCGMSPEVVQRVFDPFYTSRPPGMGSGLGLSVVHGFVVGHAGAVAVKSRIGGPTEFALYLPAVSAEALQRAASDAIEPAPSQSPSGTATERTKSRLLYVDDDEALVFLARRLLERRGFVVHGYVDADEALQALESDPQAFDALVTDLSMPRLSGLELAESALALRPDLPVVLLSGYLRPEDETAAERLGIRALILKPDTVEALAETLDRLLAPSASSR